MTNFRSLDQKRIRSNFSGHAGEYDRYAVVQKRVIERLMGTLRSEGSLRGPFLDVGTGTGILAARIAAEFPALQPVACDLAHGMTSMTAMRLGGAAAVDADALALPFRELSMNLVVSSSVYQWVQDLPQAFRECARILSEEGLFAFALFGEGTLCELRSAHLQSVREIKGNALSHFQTFPAESQVRDALSSAGFRYFKVWGEQEREMHDGVISLLRGLKKIGAANAASDRPGGFASRRVMQRMLELYEENYREAGGIPATYQVIYGKARKSL